MADAIPITDEELFAYVDDDDNEINVLSVEADEYRAASETPMGGGSYPDLDSLPQIEGVTLVGNKTFADLGLVPLSDEDIDDIIEEVEA